jgi:predicted nuclease with TOPRIM domain
VQVIFSEEIMVKETVAPVQERLQILEGQVEILKERIESLESQNRLHQEHFERLFRILKFEWEPLHYYVDLGSVVRRCRIFPRSDYEIRDEKKSVSRWWR